LITAATLQHTAQLLYSKKIQVAFGGRIFSLHPDLLHSIAGHFLGYQLSSSVEQVDLILDHRIKDAAPRPASPEYVAAHQAFNAKRGQIELTFKQMLEPLLISPENIKTGLNFLGDNILAALQLGDMSHVSTEVDWLKTLLQAHQADPRELIHFMEAYAAAINKNINGQGRPIFHWLASEVEKLKVKNLE
jgi:hypothetical protein